MYNVKQHNQHTADEHNKNGNNELKKSPLLLVNKELQHDSQSFQLFQQLNISDMALSSMVLEGDTQLYFDEDFQVPFDAHLMPLSVLSGQITSTYNEENNNGGSVNVIQSFIDDKKNEGLARSCGGISSQRSSIGRACFLPNSHSEGCLYQQQEVVVTSDEEEGTDYLPTEPLFSMTSSNNNSQFLLSSYASGMAFSSTSNNVLQSLLRHDIREQYSLANMCESNRMGQLASSDESLHRHVDANMSLRNSSSGGANLTTWYNSTNRKQCTSLQDLQARDQAGEERVYVSPPTSSSAHATTWREVKSSRESLQATNNDGMSVEVRSVQRSKSLQDQSNKLTTWKALKQVANTRFVSWNQLKRVVQENNHADGTLMDEADKNRHLGMSLCKVALTQYKPDFNSAAKQVLKRSPSQSRSGSVEDRKHRYSGTLLELFKRSNAYGKDAEFSSASAKTLPAANNSVTDDAKNWLTQLFIDTALSASLSDAERTVSDVVADKKLRPQMHHFSAQWPPEDEALLSSKPLLTAVTRRVQASSRVSNQPRPLSVPLNLNMTPKRSAGLVTTRNNRRTVTSSMLGPLPDLSFLREKQVFEHEKQLKTALLPPKKPTRNAQKSQTQFFFTAMTPQVECVSEVAVGSALSTDHWNLSNGSPQTSDSGIETAPSSSTARKSSMDNSDRLCNRCIISGQVGTSAGTVDAPVTHDLISLDDLTTPPTATNDLISAAAQRFQAQKFLFEAKHLTNGDPERSPEISRRQFVIHSPTSEHLLLRNSAAASSSSSSSSPHFEREEYEDFQPFCYSEQSLSMAVTSNGPLKPCLKMHRLDRSVSEPFNVNVADEYHPRSNRELPESSESLDAVNCQQRQPGQSDFQVKKSVSFCEKIQFHSPCNSPQASYQHGNSARDAFLKRPLSLNFDINVIPTDMGLYGEDSPPTEFRASPPSSPVSRKPTATVKCTKDVNLDSLSSKTHDDREKPEQRQERYKGYISDVIKAVNDILVSLQQSNYTANDSSTKDSIMRDMILRRLCPPLHAILSDGLSSSGTASRIIFSPKFRSPLWQLIEESCRSGLTAGRPLNDTLHVVRSITGLTTERLKFTTFICACLNSRIVNYWFTCLARNEYCLKRFYREAAFMRQCHNVQCELFADLTTSLQLLQPIDFHLSLFPDASNCNRQASALKARHDIQVVTPTTADSGNGVKRLSNLQQSKSSVITTTATVAAATTTTVAAAAAAAPRKSLLRSAFSNVRQRTEGVIRRAQSARLHHGRDNSIVEDGILTANTDSRLNSSSSASGVSSRIALKSGANGIVK